MQRCLNPRRARSCRGSAQPSRQDQAVGIQYSKVVADVNKLLNQTTQKVQQENYKKIMPEDTEALHKQLENKQYVISDLKKIQVVQGKVIRNTRKENHELKVDRDGLKKEMDLVKREIHELKKDKQELKK